MMLRIKTKKKIGYQISDIGKGGKEYNIKNYGYMPSRKIAKKAGVDIEMIERYDPNYYKPKPKKKSHWEEIIF